MYGNVVTLGGLIGAALLLVMPLTEPLSAEDSPITLIGKRGDKNSVGHGRNVALYVGSPSRFFYATHEMGDVFSATNGKVVEWNPDHVVVSPASSNPLEGARRIFVTRDDVVAVDIELRNSSPLPVEAKVVVVGDCTRSRDWRADPGGEKRTLLEPGRILLTDKGVYPEILPGGLTMAIGGSVAPRNMNAPSPGAYRIEFPIRIPAGGTRKLRIACAFSPDADRARRNLESVLKSRDPQKANRRDWADFFQKEVPQFSCSDRAIEELYYFRWWLLKFSTAGGGLGYFKYPVVMEGRQAFQTYCCYSAPFMAHDLNWSRNPQTGFGHIAGMVEAAFEDGRFPWYVSPRTNRVPIHHRSGTGLSLLPQTAWEHYLIHGDKNLLRTIYPGLRKNVEWWIKDRDADGNGLFRVDHQLETGMDDLFRWGESNADLRYEALDATSYAYANLTAVGEMAKTLGEEADSARFSAYAEKAGNAVNSMLWDSVQGAYRDRRPDTGEIAALGAITTFYPFYAGIGRKDQMPVFRKHLLNPDAFGLPYPVPALSKNHPRFKPEGYWEGPSWPAATSHVVEAFASAAKRHDRSLLAQAAELFRRAMRNHLQPRPDFYERYNPLNGRPLSTFRDYMHSWWIDLLIRHGVGLNPQPDGALVIDPLPMGWTRFSLKNAPFRGTKIDVFYSESDGLTLRSNGKTLLHDKGFRPGSKTVRVVP